MKGRGFLLLFAGVLMLAAAASGAVAIRSYDFGWHVRAGMEILASGQPPRHDTLSFTSGGAPWVDHEWLFQAVLAWLVQTWSVSAAWLAKLVLVMLAVLPGGLYLLRRGHGPLPVMVLLLLALEGARFRFFARPEMVGLVLCCGLLVLLHAALQRFQDARSPWPPLALVPPLMILWVNLHPSALLGTALLVVTATVLVVQLRSLDRAWPFVAMAGAGGLAMVANPYGAEIFHVPLGIGRVLSNPDLSNPEWGPSWQPVFWMFWFLLPLLLAAVVHRWRKRQPLSLPVLAWGVCLAVPAMVSLRFLGFFYLALPMLVLGGLPRPMKTSGASPRLQRVTALALAVVVAACFLLWPAGGRLGSGLAPGRFPEAMAGSWRSAGLTGPLYHPVRFGGYLSWQLAPARVFVDGRNEVHGPLLNAMAECRSRGDIVCWDSLMERWEVRAAILGYEENRLAVILPDGSMQERSERAVYFRRQNWALVDWDDTAMLLVRRDLLPQLPLGMGEDRWLRPDEPERLEAELRGGQTSPAEALAALERHRERHPNSWRARRAAAILDRYQAIEPPVAGTPAGDNQARK